MRRRNAILRVATVAVSIVALGGGALAATSMDNTGSADADGLTAAAHATAHVDLSSVAGGVLSALVGGSNPSTTVSQRDANEHANANATTTTTTTATTTNTTTSDEDAKTNTSDKDTETDTDVEHGQQVGQTGTSGTKPGFGCGDTNHEHSGPPGRPGATPPPGCAKSHD